MNFGISSFFVLCILALIHLFAGRLHFLEVVPRTRWLSFAGGISVAYAFMHLLPELNEHQEVLERGASGPAELIKHHAYLIALLGLGSFYGLEKVTKKSRSEQTRQRKEDVASKGVFWLSIASFSLYNALFGYLLISQPNTDVGNLLLFGFAIGLHFLVNDYSLREHHKAMYHRIGRWIVATAIIAGGIAGHVTEINESMIAMLAAFLSGGIILNILKEELPEERESRFSAFAIGALFYAALLLML